MYISPIKVNTSYEPLTAEKYDDMILESVLYKVDVEVDKEELLKAIRYDRDQYVKGFDDGVESVKSKPVKDRWIPVTEHFPEDDVPVQACYVGYNSGLLKSDFLVCRHEDEWCVWDSEPHSYNKCKVIITHWKPLAKPPKGEV